MEQICLPKFESQVNDKDLMYMWVSDHKFIMVTLELPWQQASY